MADLPPPPKGFAVDKPPAQAAALPAPPKGFTLDQPHSGSGQSAPPSAPQNTAFFGAATLLPEKVQGWLPSFVKGPSVGDQLANEHERTAAEEKRLGRPLSLSERTKVTPATENPVAMGFATHQVGELGEAMASTNASAAENLINTLYKRSAKPGVASAGRTAGQRDLYYDRTRSAIDSIVENKANLQFADPAGNVTKGHLPQDLEQFSDAISQTKKEVFRQYDAMARQAQASVIGVPLFSIANELDTLSRDQVINVNNPSVAKYAKELARRHRKLSFYTLEQAQDSIAQFNQGLKAFYKNPGIDTASRAAVDEKVASLLRDELNSAIEYGVGPGYQELKNKYGALSTIERDVANRAQVVGRQEAGGGLMGRIVDVGAISEFFHGLMTMNPMAMISAVGLKGAGEYLKYLRSPNRAISRLFQTAEEQRNPTPRPPIVPNVPLSPIFSPAANAMGLQQQ